MTDAPIDFYFDFSSPYGYFAANRIDELASKYGRRVAWRPLLLGAVFKINGQQPLPNIPIKGDYARRDLVRSARWFGLPFRIPSRFPIGTIAPVRAFYWTSDRDPALARTLALALYRAYFIDDLDISAPSATADVAAAVGIDRAALAAALEDTAVKERVRREVDAAIAKGVFSSPYIVVDGEPFWGSDRLDQVDKWLATGGW
jgi:2-hydroxychromene-2-carboxylate isomerase